MFEVLKRWGAMRYPWPLWLIPVLLISPAALLIPVNVFDQYPWVKTYAEWLAQWIPMIDRAAHLHPHPQQFKAFFAYAWSWLPLCLVLAWFDGIERRRKALSVTGKDAVSFSCLCIATWFSLMLIFAPKGFFFDVKPMLRSDGRAFLYATSLSWFLFASVQVYGVAICAVVDFEYGKSIYRRWFGSPINSK
jgi:hypothetical protein